MLVVGHFKKNEMGKIIKGASKAHLERKKRGMFGKLTPPISIEL